MTDLLNTMSAYCRTDSWAVWETDSNGALTGDTEFPLEQARATAHSDTMVVALNPGGNGATAEKRNDWGNFHASEAKHNDIFLANALLGTPFWGGYIADLLPDVYESDSGEVMPTDAIKTQAVETLAEKANRLGASSVLCLGSKTETAVRDRLALLKEKAGIGPGSVHYVWHYSGANARMHKNDISIYRAHVRDVLGLT